MCDGTQLGAMDDRGQPAAEKAAETWADSEIFGLVTLSVVHHYTPEQIAQQLGRTPDAIRAMIHRLRTGEHPYPTGCRLKLSDAPPAHRRTPPAVSDERARFERDGEILRRLEDLARVQEALRDMMVGLIAAKNLNDDRWTISRVMQVVPPDCGMRIVEAMRKMQTFGVEKVYELAPGTPATDPDAPRPQSTGV